MKKFTALFLAIIMVFALAACGGNTTSTDSGINQPASSANGQSNVQDNADGSQTDSNTDTAKILVAYFSATNTTEGVAKTIADSIGADLYEITPEQP